MKAPIEGMTTKPYGEPYMIGAWIALLMYAGTDDSHLKQFKADTGHDLPDLCGSRGIARMIDDATGRSRIVIVAFADWVTRNLWGEEEADSNPCTTWRAA